MRLYEGPRQAFDSHSYFSDMMKILKKSKTEHSEHPGHHHDADETNEARRARMRALTIGCIGVVYGDIGTSPLYAFREAAIHIASDGSIKTSEIFGVLSLIIWTLLIIVTFKYVMFLLRVDNRGEGGILSLMALAQKSVDKRTAGFIFFMGMLGAALFYGDAAITPSISVLSAVEGLKLISPKLGSYVLSITIVILFGLFAIQKRGTASMSNLFGPLTAIWFVVIAVMGAYWITKAPSVLFSVNPYYAISFFIHHGLLSFVVLGSVFLAVTGAEALYADLGHFGRKPIQVAWIYLVFPALVLNYMGQGALILNDHAAIDNPFYHMAPGLFFWPVFALATAATIIASQAVITGAYSMTRQAIQLGLFPRMEIRHTSSQVEGQVYMPKINNILLFAVLFLCLVFGNSSALASAYGISVTGTMIVTSALAFIVMWRAKKKNPFIVGVLILPLMAIECVFLAANMLKIFDGGIFPLIFAAFLVLAMSVWVKGSKYLYKKAQRHSIQLTDLVERLEREPLARVPGTAVYLTSDPAYAPIALMQNIKHNKVLHEKNIVVSVITSHFPKVPESQRIVIQPLSSDMTRVFVNYGFMEMPHIPRELALARTQGLDVDIENVSYFLGRRSIVSDPHRGLPAWQDNIYIAMMKSSSAATDFYRLPPDRVVELGIRMTI